MRRFWTWMLRSPSWSAASTRSCGWHTRKTNSDRSARLFSARSAKRYCIDLWVRSDKRSDNFSTCPIYSSHRRCVSVRCRKPVVVRVAWKSSTTLGNMQSSPRCTVPGSTGVCRSPPVPCTATRKTRSHRCGTPEHTGTACFTSNVTFFPPP